MSSLRTKAPALAPVAPRRRRLAAGRPFGLLALPLAPRKGGQGSPPGPRVATSLAPPGPQAALPAHRTWDLAEGRYWMWVAFRITRERREPSSASHEEYLSSPLTSTGSPFFLYFATFSPISRQATTGTKSAFVSDALPGRLTAIVKRHRETSSPSPVMTFSSCGSFVRYPACMDSLKPITA